MSYQRRSLWKSTREWWHTTRSSKEWQDSFNPTFAQASVPLQETRLHPQDPKDAITVTLYKNKGDRIDCNYYRSISLLSIVGKAFARVMLTRLQSLSSRVYPESQCGFWAGWSTIDMVFSIRQLQEKCREQQMPLYIAFVDLTKAIDLFFHKWLFKILEKIVCSHIYLPSSYDSSMKIERAQFS